MQALSSVDSNRIPERSTPGCLEFRTALAAALLLLGLRYSSADSQELSPMPPSQSSQSDQSSHGDTVERATAAIPMFSTPFADRTKDDGKHLKSTNITAGVFAATAQSEKKRASRKAYVWVGAIMGGVVTAVALAISSSGGPSSAFTLAPFVLGGALIGGLIGAVVHPGT